MESQDRDVLDNLLDGALKRYGNVEPRAGLEGRVLATLAAHRRSARLGGGWVWASVVVSVTALIVLLWIGVEYRRTSPTIVAARPNVSEKSFEKRNAPIPPAPVRSPATQGIRRQRTPVPVKVANTAEPRLVQFPAPRPLSEQEQLLVRYVREYPQEAVLIAQAQAEQEKEYEKLVEDESSTTNSD